MNKNYQQEAYEARQTIFGDLGMVCNPGYRQPIEVGQMGIVVTEKKPGDKIWCGRRQKWETVE